MGRPSGTTKSADGVKNQIVALSALTAHPRNYNRHSDAQLADLQESLRQFGQVRSIVVQADKTGKRYTTVAGHGIVEAAKREGLTELRADIIPASWSQTRVLAYLAADNELAKHGDPDQDQLAAIVREVMDKEGAALARLAAGEQSALDALLARGQAKEETADVGELVDKAAELQKKWKVQRGDVWQISKHRLMCGDSTSSEDVTKLMGGERADCVFTSPPYAVGVDYGEYQDTIGNLREMLPKLSHLWLDVVADGGFAVINFGDIANGRKMAESKEPCEYPMAIEYFPVFRHDGWALWSRRIWCKPNPRVYAPWAIQSNRAATDFEHLWTWKKQGEPIVKRVNGDFQSANGWRESIHLQGVDEGKEVHGAGMATGIAHWMINVHSRMNGIVHEPFTGTGTTLVACEQTGRIGRGMEISEKYCAVTLERLSLLGLTPQRIESVNNGKSKA